MAKIEELKKYLTHKFSCGCYTGEDYKSFQTKYINYLKTVCRENHWQSDRCGQACAKGAPVREGTAITVHGKRYEQAK